VNPPKPNPHRQWLLIAIGNHFRSHRQWLPTIQKQLIQQLGKGGFNNNRPPISMEIKLFALWRTR